MGVSFDVVRCVYHLLPPPGHPSDPSMPVVSVEGSSVSIQLSTRYPGTNARGQFRFSLIFSAASTAKRQSLQPTEVQVDPIGLDSSVTTTHTLTDVAAGSYSVSVMAENEHGTSQDVTVTFLVEGMYVLSRQYTSLWNVCAVCVCCSVLSGIQVVYASIVMPYCHFKHTIFTYACRSVMGHYSEYNNCNSYYT